MRLRIKKALKLFIPLLALTAILSNCSSHKNWHTASRESAGLAPDPATNNEAVLQVYGAPAWSWRGWFAIHTWLAAKPSGADHYRVYEVIGWRLHRTGSVLRIAQDLPDRYWFGKKPRILIDHRGPEVDQLIIAVDRAARAYPWSKEYRVFPGPNSNTFTAWVGNQVPELNLNLPFTAIGSGYADNAK